MVSWVRRVPQDVQIPFFWDPVYTRRFGRFHFIIFFVSFRWDETFLNDSTDHKVKAESNERSEAWARPELRFFEDDALIVHRQKFSNE